MAETVKNVSGLVNIVSVDHYCTMRGTSRILGTGVDFPFAPFQGNLRLRGCKALCGAEEAK